MNVRCTRTALLRVILTAFGGTVQTATLTWNGAGDGHSWNDSENSSNGVQ